jgi:hypothetical protein
VTLIEMVVALSLTTIVIAAATSVMFVASRALPKSADASVRATDAALALAMLEAEAQTAQAVRMRADGIMMRIPDRTGDLVADTVTYAWGGVAGNPLSRHDGSTTVDIVTGVQAATFDWTMARGSATAVGTVYVTLELDSGLVLRSTIRFPSEPENTL